MSTKFAEKTYCTQSAIDDDKAIKFSDDGTHNCSQNLNHEFIKAELAKCDGKPNCTLDFTDPTKIINSYDEDGQCGK